MTFELWILLGAAFLGLLHAGVVYASGTAGELSQCGSVLYLAGRTVFLPLYATGIPWLRTISWKIATLGLALVGAEAVF